MNWNRILTGVALVLGVQASLSAAEYRTANFDVVADTYSLAQKVGDEAEKTRSTLAQHWLKRPLGDWDFRCRIEVTSHDHKGSGWTSYHILHGDVIGVSIQIQGSPERLFEYLLPHEMTHAVLVSALGEVIPRWADEGAAMVAESQSERIRQRVVVAQLLKTGDVIPFDKLLRMKEYPRDKRKLHAFYAQSQALTEFLIEHRGRTEFLRFVRDGQSGDWDRAIRDHYGFEDANALQAAWSEWVMPITQAAR